MTSDEVIDGQCAAFAMLLDATYDIPATIAFYGTGRPTPDRKKDQ